MTRWNGALAVVLVGCACSPAPSAREQPAKPVAHEREPVASPEGQPLPKGVPEPPPLPKDESACVVRRWYSPDPKWEVTELDYDAATRTIGTAQPRRYDAEGRFVALGEPGHEAQTASYDAHGNMIEYTLYDQQGGLEDRTRWQIRYEGNPPRVQERIVPGGGRHTYRYDADGRLAEEIMPPLYGWPWTRKFRWEGGRLVAVESVTTPRLQTALSFDVAERFRYDASGRLAEYERDGDRRDRDAADGRPEQIVRYQYDAAGQLSRVESDGRFGDVSPEAPDGRTDHIRLFSAPCADVLRLWPEHYSGLPLLGLPETIEVRWY